MNREMIWELLLYVSGQSAKHKKASETIGEICRQYLQGRFQLTVVDLDENPEKAFQDQIIATPTLIRKAPKPDRRIIGDFSQTKTVLEALEII